MNDDGKEGVWLLVTAHCRVRGRAPRVLCLGRAKHESDNSAFLLPRLYSPAFTQSTLVTAPLPACCRSERGKRGGSSDDCLHLAAQEIWDLQAAKKRGCSPRSEIIYSSSGTNLKIYIDFMCSANKLLRKSYHIGLAYSSVAPLPPPLSLVRVSPLMFTVPPPLLLCLCQC